VLNDAGVNPSDIQSLVLVGGSTRIPLVHRRAAEIFGREPLDDIDPEEVVALGAALQAEALTRGSEALLLDVTPLSLGIETMGGLAEKVIPRNTPVPMARAQEFTTYQDGQTAMMIHAVQGERELVSENRSLAQFELDGIPPMAAGVARIRVTFAVDTDGLLTVSAEETETGARQQVSVKPSYGLSEDEMATMLRASVEHAAEDMKARLLREARVDGERMLQAVAAALAADGDLLSEAEREGVGAVTAELEARIKGEDRGAILTAVEACNAGTEEFASRRMDRGIRAALKGQSLDRVAERLTGRK
jgi:molecular chaperone HscA